MERERAKRISLTGPYHPLLTLATPMLIGGLQKTTLIDYPNKIAATIFTIGCNFRCSFCHNPDIVKGIAKIIPVVEVFDFLKTRRRLLDAVCITGGEPTIQSDLLSFVKKIKKLGYLIKIDTNGQRPKVIEKLIASGLIDYIAMDIKAPWRRYKNIVRRPVDLTNIKKSVIIIKKANIPYEFRSTVLPAMHSVEDITAMAGQIKGADKYVLQQFRPAQKLVDQSFADERFYTKKQLTEIIEGFKDWFGTCKVR